MGTFFRDWGTPVIVSLAQADMRRRFILVLVSLWNAASLAGEGSPRYTDAQIDSLLMRGIGMTLRQEYDSALSVFQSVSSAYPDDPMGYLYQAIVLQAVAMDYEERVPEEAFYELLSIARSKAGRISEQAPVSPWPEYALGLALGNEAVARAEEGDWFGAVTRGMSSVSSLEKALEHDSTLVDAYAGIGTFYYWKARKLGFLAWLPFFADRRDEGIAMLEICADRGHYNRYAALSSLISIFLDAGNYDKAERAARRALEAYPSNRIFLWGLATALDRSGRSLEAIGAYEALLTAILDDTRENRYNELVCRMNLLSARIAVGMTNPAAEELETIRQLSRGTFGDHLEDRVEEKRLRIRELEKAVAALTIGQR